MDEVETLAREIRAGQRQALARAITLIESTRSDHRELALELLVRLAPDAGNAFRIGISGVPGVGKSTFIEVFGQHVIEAGHRVAVLSVDPSSALSGGSLLGDKTRMQRLSRHPDAFIRPSPTGQMLGGVARRTQETMLVCEAANFDVVIVETVGIGQSETAIADITDMFILLLSPGGGDTIQGMKRGNIELADLLLVNKADGELLGAARQSATDYRHAMRQMQPRWKPWAPPVELCSALTGDGIKAAWDVVCRYRELSTSSGHFNSRRAAQACRWMWSETTELLLAALKEDPDIRQRLPALEADVTAGRVLPSVAAQQLLAMFRKR